MTSPTSLDQARAARSINLDMRNRVGSRLNCADRAVEVGNAAGCTGGWLSPEIFHEEENLIREFSDQLITALHERLLYRIRLTGCV
jgi:hypothetical protein